MNNWDFCNNEITGKYYSNCGQPLNKERINSHYIIHEIEHVLHFEKGILFTVKELLIRPGENIHSFIVRDRSRLVKPIVFIIVYSLIYTIVTHFFQLKMDTSALFKVISYLFISTFAIRSIF